jgi:hypothetical protein
MDETLSMSKLGQIQVLAEFEILGIITEDENTIIVVGMLKK